VSTAATQAERENFISRLFDRIEPAPAAAAQALARPSKFERSLTRRGKQTHTARTAAQLALPIHSDHIDTADYDAVYARATKPRQERIKLVYDLTFNPRDEHGNDMVFCTDAPVSAMLPAADADKLLADGNIAVVTPETLRARPTRGAVSAFTVVEHKTKLLPDGSSTPADRRRFIAWPRELNEWLRGRYKCDVDLQHVSRYLYAVMEDAAVTGDCKLGFWQIPIPQKARELYRFRDCTGRLFELTRMPMGVSPAVEIEQFLTEVLIGLDDVVRPEYRLCSRREAAVFVDGFRCVGTGARLEKFIAGVDKNTRALGVTLKDPLRLEKSYDFVGVTFDHVKGEVRAADKSRNKISNKMPTTMSYGDLERHVGLIIHISAIHQRPLAATWNALKWSRRRIAELNHGSRTDDKGATIPVTDTTLCDIPQCVWVELEHQRRQLLGWHKVARITGTGTCHIFSDASLTGFGGVLLRPDGTIGVVGRRWRDDEKSDNISVLEARAAYYVILGFASDVEHFSYCTLHIDNTSVQSGVRRGTAKSEALLPEIKKTAEAMQRSTRWRVVRVASEDNPADAPSRSLYVEHKTLQAQAQKAANEDARVGQNEGCVVFSS
jgi:hypothetical protein